MLERPSRDEFTQYYRTYIDLVPEGNLENILLTQLEETRRLLGTISEEQAHYRYEAGKWTLKEVVGHIADTERIMSYRLLRIARGDTLPLAGYDDIEYVKEAMFPVRKLADLVEEYAAVRQATIALVRGIPYQAWTRTGVANNSRLSARAIAYIIAGHELHHRNIIEERYLAKP